jgi:sugar phosphate isomerase/epimerase
MAYKVGVSAGWWKIARDPSLLGLAQKVVGFGATSGCQFIQVDLDTTAEFYEPELQKQMKRAKEKMGMEVGLHGEVGELMALDSAEKRLWEQSHLRLIETVKYSADLGLKYVNIHLSQRPMLSFVESQQRILGYQFPVVSFDGKPLTEITIDNPKTKEIAKKHLTRYLDHTETFQKEANKLFEEKLREAEKRVQQIIEEWRKKGKEPTPEDIGYIRKVEHDRAREETRNEAGTIEFLYRVWIKTTPEEFEKYTLNDGEFGAYHIVAAYMKEKNDSLWQSLANGKDSERLYLEDEHKFCAAIASKYIEGHLNAKTASNKRYLDGMSILEWLEAKKIYLLLEVPEAHEGTEGLLRLFNPIDAYYLIKKVNSEYVKMCIDFEHMLSHKIDVEKNIEKMPGDAGKYILLIHLGKPIPYFGTAHIPLARGSRAQEILYRWLFEFRKKGFKDGYIIFERGSGRTGAGKTPLEVMEDTILAIRQVVKYLEKDISPKELPAEFFGITWENEAVFARQAVTIKDHAWDPLEGVLLIPEEKHTLLSGRAVERGKGPEWEKGKYR